MALLAVCRVFIFYGVRRQRRMATFARISLVLILLWMLFVLISGCITQNFMFSPPSWQYDLTSNYAHVFVKLELLFVIASLAIAYVSYLAISYLIYMVSVKGITPNKLLFKKKKGSVSASKRSNEISILIQYTFTVTYIVIYIILWHNGSEFLIFLMEMWCVFS